MKIKRELEDYDKNIEENQNKVYKELENKSKDYFNVIHDQYKDVFENAGKVKKIK